MVEIEDYPGNLVEFGERFSTDAACRGYLEKIRWPDGFRCPACRGTGAWPTGRLGLWECRGCHRQTSATAGTIFEGTRKPLRFWFLAMWLITSEKNGISTLGLQRELGFTRYETVWTWLHKLRRAMVPRLPNPRFVGKTSMGPRGDAIAELDWSVGQVLACLDRNGLARDTIVMFSSDNGPVVDDGYRDQAVEKLGGHKPAGALRGGKYSKFDGGTRVPMMARWPGHIRADSVSSALISQVDLCASLAALTGQKLSGDTAPDSVNVLPALLGQSQTARQSLVEHNGTLALVEGDWKLIEPDNGPKVNQNTHTETGNDPQPQLYNLARDLGETTNLAAQYPDKVAGMTALLNEIRSRRGGRN